MRLDNTRCTAGLVFLGSRPLDLPFLATRLERVLGARGFETGMCHMLSDDHLRMGLGTFELHLNAIDTGHQNGQPGGMHTLDMVLNDGRQPDNQGDLSVSDATLTLTVTIVKRPSELPSLRDAERSTVTAHSALALSTLELAQVLDPDFVQWLQPDMMLQTSSFLSVLEKVTPRRVSAADRARKAEAERRKRPTPVLAFPQEQTNRVSRLFPDIEITCERLESHAVAETAPASPVISDEKSRLSYMRSVFGRQDVVGDTKEPSEAEALPAEPSIPSRLATWVVSFVVALISMPVGLALIAYNLLRGEDLRLALTALALTGLFSGLAAIGAIDQAVSAITGQPVVSQLLFSLPF